VTIGNQLVIVMTFWGAIVALRDIDGGWDEKAEGASAGG
jgi:hypothetical protein